jgi:hypothetical protein
MSGLDEYLARLAGESEPDSGEFTLNLEKAKETVLASLKLEPEGYPRHLLAAAYLGGAKEFQAGTRSQFLRLAPDVPRRLVFFCRFDGEPLSRGQLEGIPEAILEREDQRLQRLSLAFHQLKILRCPWLRISSWSDGHAYRLTATKNKVEITEKSIKNPRAFFRGTIVEVKSYPRPRHSARPSLSQREQLERLTQLQAVARWSPLKVSLNDERLDRIEPPPSSLHFCLWQNENATTPYAIPALEGPSDFPIIAWLDADQGHTSLIPVVQGLTLPPVRLERDSSGRVVPGLRFVLQCDELRLDPSHLRIVCDSRFQDFAQKCLGLTEQLIAEMVKTGQENARHYVLKNWSKLSHFPLTTYPLFQTKSGQILSLTELTEQQTQQRHLATELEEKDAAFAGLLLGTRRFYRFSRGLTPPDLVEVQPQGDWAALSHGEFLSFLELDRPGEFHRCPCHRQGFNSTWHPTQPWYAFQSCGEVIVWDLKLQRVLAKIEGHYDLIRFSDYGQYLHLLRQLAQRRIGHYRYDVGDFSLDQHWTKLPGTRSLIAGSHLLTWSTSCTFTVRELNNLNEPLDEFYTKERADELLDVSPNGRFVALTGKKVSYLLDCAHLTLRSLPQPLKHGLFSWDSDYLFGQVEDKVTVYSIETSENTTYEYRPDILFRSGRLLICEQNSNESPHFRSEELLKAIQAPGGRHRRDSKLFFTSEAFSPQLFVARDEHQPYELWRFGKTRANLVHGVDRSQPFLALDNSEGTLLFGLKDHLAKRTQLKGTRLWGSCLTRQHPDKLDFLSPVAGLTQFAITNSSCQRTAPDQYRTFFSTPGRGYGIAGSNGEPIYWGQQPVTHHAEHWLAWAPPGQVCPEDPALIGSRAEVIEWLSLPEVERLELHPHEDLAVVFRGGHSEIVSLDKTGLHSLNIGRRIPGLPGPFSPSGAFFFVLFREDLHVIQTSTSDTVFQLPAFTNNPEQCRWIGDHAVQSQDQIWWTTAETGWNSAQLTNWSFPDKLLVIPDCKLVVTTKNELLQFLDLTSGRTVAILQPLADHWFASSHDGRWDGSVGCHRYVKPFPNKVQTEGLLRRLVAEYAV